MRAIDLNKAIHAGLDALQVHASVSMMRLFDVAQRWEHDAKRLGEKHKNGFSPIKYISYQAFWIRKLKPISNAYLIKHLEAEGDSISPEMEIHDINERIAIRIAGRNLLEFAERGFYPTEHGDGTGHTTAVDAKILREYLRAYMNFPSQRDAGPQHEADKGSTYENLIYNQRYRTFGPHHLVHILDQAVFGALRLQACKK